MRHISRLAFTLCALLAVATSASRADVLTYDVTGHIDSNDFLLIHGPTLQWHHVDTGGAAVGRHSGNNFPTVVSTSLNGVTQMGVTDWTPTWPLPVPNEIRFEAYSSLLTGVTPILPASDPLSVDTSVIAGRGSLTVTQLPALDNDYTLIVRFSDGFSGSRDLRGLITVVTPEPASLGLLALAALPLARRRRVREVR